MKIDMDNLAMKIWMAGSLTTIAWMEIPADENPMNKGWYALNDGVMGGLSRSEYVPMDGGALQFIGVVSLENNGGFASIRRAADFLLLEGSDGIKLRVNGDGKKYQFRVRTSKQFDGISYRLTFATFKGKWKEIELKWKDFIPTFRGRRVAGAPELKPWAIDQIGFLIADKQKGPFDLHVERIESMSLK